MTGPEKVVTDFILAWESSLVASHDDYLSEDCLWLNTGFPDCEGKPAIMELMEKMIAIVPSAHADIVGMASNGDTVYTQRVDHIILRDGKEAFTVDAVSVAVVRDDKIVSWHDFFDPTPFFGMVSEEAS
jgi:limonene-1,2-epoxide hydrolase